MNDDLKKWLIRRLRRKDDFGRRLRDRLIAVAITLVAAGAILFVADLIP